MLTRGFGGEVTEVRVSVVDSVVSPAGCIDGGTFYTRWEVDPCVVTCWT